MKLLITPLLLLTSAIGAFAQGPFNVSIVPASGSKPYTQTIPFTATWSSPYGAGGILYGLFYMGGCQVRFTPSTIALLDPDTGTWVNANKPVGFGSVRNRLCAVTADKAHLDGDVLSVGLLITFSVQAVGNAYPVYLAAVDNQGRVAGYEQKGTFSVTY
jgi:hypothetical protein